MRIRGGVDSTLPAEDPQVDPLMLGGSTRTDWALVLRKEYQRTVGWAVTFAGENLAEDIVSEAFARIVAADTQPTGSPVAYLRAVTKRVWHEAAREFARYMQLLERHVVPTMDDEEGPSETLLVPLDRCRPEAWWRPKETPTEVREVGAQFRLGTIPCPVCGTRFKPIARYRQGQPARRQTTCSTRCGAIHRNRKEAA